MGAVLRNSASLTKEGRNSGAEGVRVWCEGQGRAWCPPGPEAAFGARWGCGQVRAERRCRSLLSWATGTLHNFHQPALPRRVRSPSLPPQLLFRGQMGDGFARGWIRGCRSLCCPRGSCSCSWAALGSLLLTGAGCPVLAACLPSRAEQPRLGGCCWGRIRPRLFQSCTPPPRRHPQGASQQGCSSPVSHRCCSSLAPVARLFS